MPTDPGSSLRVAVIGTGHLGRHHARILGALEGVSLVCVVDPDEDRGRAAAEMGGTRWVENMESLPSELDAVSIAVPTPHHFEIARSCVENGIHCLVEKPMTATAEESKELHGLVEKHGIIFQVGHVERFNPALDGFSIDESPPRLIEMQRLAPYTDRCADTSVVMDLMIHDIELALAIDRTQVREVIARGGVVHGPFEDWASCHLLFESGCAASLTASRVATNPLRKAWIYRSDDVIEIDFSARTTTKIGASETGVEQGSDDEPLGRELAHFVDCVRNGRRPLVSHHEGRNAVEIAHEVLKTIRAGDSL